MANPEPLVLPVHLVYQAKLVQLAHKELVAPQVFKARQVLLELRELPAPKVLPPPSQAQSEPQEPKEPLVLKAHKVTQDQPVPKVLLDQLVPLALLDQLVHQAVWEPQELKEQVVLLVHLVLLVLLEPLVQHRRCLGRRVLPGPQALLPGRGLPINRRKYNMSTTQPPGQRAQRPIRSFGWVAMN